jgi:cytochrome c-type biogenesis protein CcsB
MLWLIVIFVFNIKKYRLTRKDKWPVLAFHAAFILIFLGGAITRYWGLEGQMPIKEGETANEFISDLTYVKVNISDGSNSLTYNHEPYVMSYLNRNNTSWPLKKVFRESYAFKNKVVNLRTIDFYPLAKDSIRRGDSGQKLIRIVAMGQAGRETHHIENGKVKLVAGLWFSFNNPVEGTVQLTEIGNSIIINAPASGQFVSMKGQQLGILTDTTLLRQQTRKLEANDPDLIDFRSLYTINSVSFIVPEPAFTGSIVYYGGDKSNSGDRALSDRVKFEIISGNDKDTVVVEGGKGITFYGGKAYVNGLEVAIGYGSKRIKTGFSIRCDDFKLERYPGSRNASSYESMVTVLDNGQALPYHIFMNNVLDYDGYRFFQASYFPDESGTILSVNKDWWGTRVTYIGYFCLFLGMLLTLVWRRTHFWKLNRKLMDVQRKGLMLIPLILFLSFAGAQSPSQNYQDSFHDQTDDDPYSLPGKLGGRIINASHANIFARLLVQDFQGRIKPMDTYTLELLRKISKKDKFQNRSSVQWFLSMQLDPAYWFSQPMIFVGKKGGDRLAKEAGSNAKGYTSFLNLMDTATGQFKLQEQYISAFSKRKADQSNYDKVLISLTERYNIFGNIVYGYFTRIIPVRNDPANTWRSWVYNTEMEAVQLDSVAYAFIALYFDEVKKGLESGSWDEANKSLARISSFQKLWGKDIVPSDFKVEMEIFYNRSNIFLWLMIVYSFLGILLVILGFLEILTSNIRMYSAIRWLMKVFCGIMILALVVHFVGLGVRWYLSGHAPWSNGYEAIVFISSIGVLSGLLLYRKRNALIPAAGAIVAVIMMGFAHGGSMLDPQITPLEPVLKSYWLMVHVGIITSSYGFFGLSAVISVISLVMFCLNPTEKLRNSIQELTFVNEMAAQIGLFTLTIGTFLGGIWANESWGRYWSWDPKETWAFISIIFYATILHFRIVPGLRGKWIFNVAGMWVIWTIIFTYFGVNYYLSGLHSYAAGDPIPIPSWIPISVVIMLILSVSSYYRARLFGTRHL